MTKEPIFSKEEIEAYIKDFDQKKEVLKKEFQDEKLWKVADTQKKLGIKTFRREYEGKFRLYWSRGFVPNAKIDEYIKWDKKAIIENDEKALMKTSLFLKFYKILERYDEDCYLSWTCGRSGLKGTKNREFLSLSKFFRSENEFFEYQESIKPEDDKKVPLENPKCNTRGKLLTGLWLVQKDNGCELIFFNFVNPRGKLSPKLLNPSILKACKDVIKKAKKHFEKK